MWAFILASPNWTGSIPATARRAASSCQASGTAAAAPVGELSVAALRACLEVDVAGVTLPVDGGWTVH